jgi:hypothetical protein
MKLLIMQFCPTWYDEIELENVFTLREVQASEMWDEVE